MSRTASGRVHTEAGRAGPTSSGLIRPTKRGLGLVVIVAVAVYMAWEYGARSLDAMVVPLLVVSAAAVLSVGLADRPRVERRPVAPGSVGETRTVELVIASDRAQSATVVDEIGSGLAPVDSEVSTGRIDLTLSGETVVEYDVRLEERGEHTVGPTTIAVCDVLGLVERRFKYDRRATVVVYPPIYGLRGRARRDFAAIADTARRHDRDEFDHLREYERGDALRDVHWKSAAKRPADELVVKEFVADEEFDHVSIVAEAASGQDDEMAAAAATIVTYLLDVGVGVSLTTPDGRRETMGSDRDDGPLRLLATTGHGVVDDRRHHEADVVVCADLDGTSVGFHDRTIPFDRLRSGVIRGSATNASRDPHGGSADGSRPSVGDGADDGYSNERDDESSDGTDDAPSEGASGVKV